MTVNLAATSKDSNFSTIPDDKDWKLTMPSSSTSAPTRPSAASSSRTCRRTRPRRPPPTLQAHRRGEVRPHLQWRAEEHRPRRYGDRHRPAGPDWRDPPPVPCCSTTSSSWTTTPCTPPPAGPATPPCVQETPQDGRPRGGREMNIEKRRCCTTPSTAATATTSPRGREVPLPQGVPSPGGGRGTGEKFLSRRTPRASVPQGSPLVGGARVHLQRHVEGVGARRFMAGSRRTTRRRVVLGGSARFRRPPLRLCCRYIFDTI